MTTSEADITALLGCSSSDWEQVRSEAREEGRVSVTRARRQVSLNDNDNYDNDTRHCIQTQQQSSLAGLVARSEAEAGVCWVRGRLVRSILVILASHWSMLVILASHWSKLVILASHWSILVILSSDWSILIILIRSQEAGQRLHIVRAVRPRPGVMAEMYEKHL